MYTTYPGIDLGGKNCSDSDRDSGEIEIHPYSKSENTNKSNNDPGPSIEEYRIARNRVIGHACDLFLTIASAPCQSVMSYLSNLMM